MYNPSRGGVRGGADQFTWESVKSDKHRENYLGHSLKAPIGRWQKGKDLTWYAKERNDTDDAVNSDKSELVAIKRAEEEAMLIALGHNVIRKETQALTKEEMGEALKRNAGDRDTLNIERIDGVGTSSARAALLMGSGKQGRHKNEGVMFERPPEGSRGKSVDSEKRRESSPSVRRKKSRKHSKKLKKEKKQKKAKKHRKKSSDSEENSNSESETPIKVSKKEKHLDEERSSRKSKHKKHKKLSSRKRRDKSSDSDSRTKHNKRKSEDSSTLPKRRRHDSSECD